MQNLILTYRDIDRLPVIFAIRKMVQRHYDVDVRVVQIRDDDAFEAALFNGSADVLIEHLEFLYAEAANGKKITMFCAPSRGAVCIWSFRPRSALSRSSEARRWR
jgi:hypothetical protein